jgi:pimeloyl-ACP methyl ester carboxylesterase
VHSFNFSGHGGQPLPAAGLSISLFAGELLQYIETHKLQGASVFGYSMGGYVALQLQKSHPGIMGKIITLATKFHWDPQTAERECGMLEWEKIEIKLPQFAETLAKRHAPVNWKELMEATTDMLRAMGNDAPLKPEDYPKLNTPVLLLLGDRDKMVSLDETLAVYRALPQAFMGMLPATPHALEQVNPVLLAGLIRPFLEG